MGALLHIFVLEIEGLVICAGLGRPVLVLILAGAGIALGEFPERGEKTFGMVFC